MKKFIKNKDGDFVIIGVILIPLIVIIVFTIIFTQMRNTITYKKTQSSIDNILYWASEKYGEIKFNNNEEAYCDFGHEMLNNAANSDVLDATKVTNNTQYTNSGDVKETFLWNFNSYIKKTDGYNDLWTYSIELKTNENHSISANKSENNKYIIAQVIVVLPDVTNRDSDYLGVAIGETNWSGWYGANIEHWESCVKRYKAWYPDNYENWLKGKAKAPSGIRMMKVEVSTSCY